MNFERAARFGKAAGYDEVALTYMAGGTTNWNANDAPLATLSIGAGNTTMGAPSSVVAGRTYTIRITQSSTTRTIAWNTVFKWVGGAGNVPVISSSNGAVDRFTFIGRAGGFLEEVGRAQGIA